MASTIYGIGMLVVAIGIPAAMIKSSTEIFKLAHLMSQKVRNNPFQSY
jgi:hypothetical protein